MRRLVCLWAVVVSMPVALGLMSGILLPTQAATPPGLPGLPGPLCELAGPCWSTMVTPNEGSASVLNAVSCTSATFCMSVGYSNSPIWQGIAEQWNGSTWSTTQAVNPEANVLASVSCTSSAFCMAVGQAGSGTSPRSLAEAWDGSHWSQNALSAQNTDARLQGVSCASANFCMAVGQYETSALAQEWNGSTWTPVEVPETSSWGNLLAVACTSATFCIAVGEFANGSESLANQTVAEKWNGSAWTPMVTPNVTEPALSAVSCTSSSFCITVGSGGSPSQTIAKKWDGISWSNMVTTNPGSTSILDGISCLSPASCIASGYQTDATNGGGVPYATLVEQWTGSSWSAMTTTNPQATSSFSGVSCPSTAFCVAVGLSAPAPEPASTSTLAEDYRNPIAAIP